MKKLSISQICIEKEHRVNEYLSKLGYPLAVHIVLLQESKYALYFDNLEKDYSLRSIGNHSSFTARQVYNLLQNFYLLLEQLLTFKNVVHEVDEPLFPLEPPVGSPDDLPF